VRASSRTPSDADGRWVLTATILGSSMAFIDGTVVNVALPAVQVALHATASDLQWVVESYALLLASLLLLGGSLGDLYGRRKIFVIGVFIFAVGSAWCGLASSIEFLVIARAFQGVGAALLIPGSLALISSSFPASERGRAIGTWSGFTAITATIGPVLGGWLVEHGSWRWVFFINIPIAVVVVASTLFHVSESRNEEASRILDWRGALLATVGLGAITFALIEAPRGGRSLWTVGLGGVVALAAFLFFESRSLAPMVSLRLFRSRNFSGTNLLTFSLYAALSSLLFFLPLDLIQVQHYSATQAGGTLLPLILLIFLLSRWSGGLIAHYGARVPLTIGPLITAAGYALMLRCGLSGSYWTTLFPAVLTLGFGMAISVAPLTTAVMESVPPSEAGVASGVNNAVSRIAGLLAVAVFGLVLSFGFNRSLNHSLGQLTLSSEALQRIDHERPKLAGAETSDPRLRRAINEAFVSGYHDIILISFALSVLSALSAQMISSGVRETSDQ
jgi:EmrB/QacA subfamily drug resistance transporter